MKSFPYLVVFLASLFVCEDALAQQRPNEPVFGRGRFLKRLRDEVFGPSQPNPTQQRQKQQQSNAKGKTPTPIPGQANSRNPNARNPYSRQPTNAAKQRSSYSRQPYSAQPRPPQRTGSQQAKIHGNGSDFGIQLTTDKNDNLVVERVSPTGNAARAGIKRGDVV